MGARAQTGCVKETLLERCRMKTFDVFFNTLYIPVLYYSRSFYDVPPTNSTSCPNSSYSHRAGEILRIED